MSRLNHRGLFSFPSETYIFLLLLGMSACLLLPYIWIAQYAHPSADDYGYAVRALHLGWIEAQLHYYHNWSGRYTATSLLSGSPVYFRNLTLYKLMPVIWIGLLTAACFTFAKVVWPKLQLKRRILLTLGLLIIYLAFMPEPTEGIYWYAGAATYQFANVLTLLAYSFLIKAYRSEGNVKGVYYVFAGITTILLTGLNETSMLIHLVLLFYFNVWSWVSKKKWETGLGVIFLLCIVGVSLVYLAPGNGVRGSNFPTAQSPWALVEAGIFTVYLGLKWLFLTPIWMLILLQSSSNPFFYKQAIPPTSHRIPTWAGWLMYFFLLYAATFVGFWSLGFRPPLRTQNVIFMIFLWGLMLNLQNSASYLQKVSLYIPRSPYVKYALSFGIGVYLCLPISHIPKLYSDLYTGKLKAFSQKMEQRHTQLEQERDSIVYVATIPEASDNFIFYEDIQADSTHWSNQRVAWYFGKKAVVRK